MLMHYTTKQVAAPNPDIHIAKKARQHFLKPVLKVEWTRRNFNDINLKEMMKERKYLKHPTICALYFLHHITKFLNFKNKMDKRKNSFCS